MKRLIILHPFLFSVYPVLFLYTHNIAQTPAREVFVPFVVSLAFSAILFLVFEAVFKNALKAGIAASIIILLFFSYGHVYEILDGRFSFGRHRYLLPAWCALGAAGVYLAAAARMKLEGMTRALNIAALTLVMISAVSAGFYESGREAEKESAFSAAEAYLTGGEKQRDIYYIIFDSYASEGTLKEIYGYDNSGFSEFLEQKGFYVAEEARSNYPATRRSLASSLNMEYLDPEPGPDLDGMINNNSVVNILRKQGYKFIHFSSGWGPTDNNIYADKDIKCGILNEFQIVLIQTTVLRALTLMMPFGYYIENDMRERISGTFDELSVMPDTEGPKFVFAHFIPPHPPYLFGAEGERVQKIRISMCWTYFSQKELYINQLIFITEKIESLVKSLLDNSEEEPIIIIQGDHGPASTFKHFNGSWKNPTDVNLRERFSILNAYYLPGGACKNLYEDISPVNTFRVVFNSYFGAGLEILDDRCMYSTYEDPFDFTDETDDF